jgi:hypothetical protein
VREGRVFRGGAGGRQNPFTFTWIHKQRTNGSDRPIPERQRSSQ